MISVLIVSCLVALSSALYSPSDDVIELTANNFDRLVKQSDDIWLVEFYAPWCGHCKNLAPEWKKAASALKGVVKVGAVDMDVHQSVGGPYGIRGFPTIKIFGANKNSPQDYNGARSASGIVDGAMKEVQNLVKSRLSGGGRSSGGSGSRDSGGSGGSGKAGDPKDVIELTDSNFEDEVLKSKDIVMVEFFAPWCGHCKNLAPEWAKAATEMKGKVKFGALDATVHTVMASRYGVRGYPSIKMFQNGEATDFEGGRTASDIITFASEKLAENVPAPEAYQITSEQVLKDNCENHQLCIIAILPHILDCQSQCRNDFLAIMKKEGELFKKNQWGWLWAEAMSQQAVEESLGIGGFGYPALAAVNTRKMKYALMKGSFSASGVHDFLRELSFGRGSTAPIKNAQLPKVVETEAWDGKDGEMPVEEDWDLDDVELEPLDTDKKDEL